MKNEFNGYSLFNEDGNSQRRAYNRVMTARNIFEAHGSVMCQKYLDYITGPEKAELLLMSLAIKAKGSDEVAREVQFNVYSF